MQSVMTAAIALLLIAAVFGCVEVPEKLDCTNVDCVAVADTLCEEGYFQFCKELTQEELDRIFACLLFGGENCLGAVDRDGPDPAGRLSELIEGETP